MNERLGLIIKEIACEPGITLNGLRLRLCTQGMPVSERTLATDIARLKSEFQLLPAGGRLRQGYYLKGMVTLSPADLALVTDALCAFSTTLKDPVAQDVLDRITKASEGLTATVSKLQHRERHLAQKVITPTAASLKEVESIIMTAIGQRLATSFEYASPRLNAPMRIRSYPLFKTFFQRGWYLIVRTIDDGRFYPCRMDRIRLPKLLNLGPNQKLIENVHDASYLISCGWGMTFPSSVADAKRLESCPETIVRFDSSVAEYILEGVERHPRSKIMVVQDGTGDVLFTIRLDDLWEFRQWVRSFGSKAWFVAPQHVVDEETAEFARLAHRYKKKLV